MVVECYLKQCTVDVVEVNIKNFDIVDVFDFVVSLERLLQDNIIEGMLRMPLVRTHDCAL
jgi:hypothetical protein